jgi:hypothetical protein
MVVEQALEGVPEQHDPGLSGIVPSARGAIRTHDPWLRRPSVDAVPVDDLRKMAIASFRASVSTL